MRAMTRTSTADWPCTIARAVDLLGEGWTLLVMRQACLGTRRFEDFQRHLGIGRNILTLRLQRLVDEGLLTRTEYQERPVRYEYRLTEKGIALQPVLLELMHWADEYMPVKGGPIHTLTHNDCGHEFHPVQTCSHCGEEVTARNITRRMGPGSTAAQRKAEKRWLQARAEATAAG